MNDFLEALKNVNVNLDTESFVEIMRLKVIGDISNNVLNTITTILIMMSMSIIGFIVWKKGMTYYYERIKKLKEER